MGDTRPFREPCDNSRLCGLGSLWQHGRTADTKTPKYVNITTVPNPVGGPDIPPYERFTPSGGGDLGCAISSCNPDTAPCSQWLLPITANTFAHTPGDNVNFSVCRDQGWKGVASRRFWSGRLGYTNRESSNGPDTIMGCGSSQAAWRAPTPGIDQTKYLSVAIDSEWEQTIWDFSGGTGVPTTVTETMAMTQTIHALSGLYNFSGLTMSPDTINNHALQLYAPALWNWSEIINRMTLPIVSSEVTTYSGGPTAGSVTGSSTYAIVGLQPDEVLSWDLAAGSFSRTLYSYDSYNSNAQLLSGVETVSVSGNSIEYSLDQKEYYPHGISPTQSDLTQETILTVVGTLGNVHPSTDIKTDVETNLLVLWPLDNNELYPFRFDSKMGAVPLVSRDEIDNVGFTDGWWVKDYGTPVTNSSGSFGDPGWDGECGIVLSQDPSTGGTTIAIDMPVTAGDVIDNAVGGFSYTTATAFAVVGGSFPPGVSMDPVTGHISGTASATGHYGVTVAMTGAAPLVTGNILGAPKPAGYQDFFDFNYRDWRGCCFTNLESGAITWSWYQFGWGMKVSDYNSLVSCHLPLNATQWTNFFQAVNKPQGAFLFYNDTGTSYWGNSCHSSDDSPSGAQEAGALWACKYAECLEIWPSQNFGMPAGDAKFWHDETHVFCAVNVSGSGESSTWNITDAFGNVPPDGTDFGGVWGGPVVAGFYNVSGYASGVLTLGAKVYDLPSNWASKAILDTATCFGKLRWPDKPALLGRAAVTTTAPGTTLVFASAQPAFGMTTATHQEQIDLYDTSMNLLTANVTATRVTLAWASGTVRALGDLIVDSNNNVQQCAHAGTSGGSAPIWATVGITADNDVVWTFVGGVDSVFTIASGHPLTKYVTINGVKWYVNDNSPKGDYAYLQWVSDFRSIGDYTRLFGTLDCSGTQVPLPTTNAGGGPVTQPFKSFTQTADCLAFTQCSPRVVCISPNGETFPNGITYPFPETFLFDEQYGSKWWGYVQSTMTDLLWQQPHRPCGLHSCSAWTEDSGVCITPDVIWDGEGVGCPGDPDLSPEFVTPVYYFGHRPQVEARLTVPDNYGMGQDEAGPALPTGIQIGWLSPVDYSTGDVALPPVPPGAEIGTGEPASAATAWLMHELFCGSTPCRFDYTLPGC